MGIVLGIKIFFHLFNFSVSGKRFFLSRHEVKPGALSLEQAEHGPSHEIYDIRDAPPEEGGGFAWASVLKTGRKRQLNARRGVNIWCSSHRFFPSFKIDAKTNRSLIFFPPWTSRVKKWARNIFKEEKVATG